MKWNPTLMVVPILFTVAAFAQTDDSFDEMQQKLNRIHNEEQSVLARFEKKEIDREHARSQLSDLIARGRKIVDDPDYQAEVMLSAGKQAEARKAQEQAIWAEHKSMQKTALQALHSTADAQKAPAQR